MPQGRPATETYEDLDWQSYFCGAGGESEGVRWAGVKLEVAANHWDLALRSHARNHYCEHDKADLVTVERGRYRHTWGAWFSPECTKFSKARGKKRNFTVKTMALPGIGEEGPPPTEAEVRSRVTMQAVVRLSAWHRYKVVVVENVLDILEWDELSRWYAEMEGLGYQHRTVYLNAMFFGTPQSRNRFFAVFWQKGEPVPDLDFNPPAWCPKCETVVEAIQSWKNPRKPFGSYRTQYWYRCPQCTTIARPFVLPAISAIDPSIPAPRICERKTPPVPNTMRRLAVGAARYWGATGIVFDLLRDPRYRDVMTMPLPTQTTRQSLAMAIWPLAVHGADDPSLVIKNYGDAEAAGPMSIAPGEAPLGTVTGVDHHALLQPPFILAGAGNTFDRPASGYFRVRDPREDPLWALQGTQTIAIAQPPEAFISSYYGNGGNWPVGVPMPTVTGHDRHGYLEPGEELGDRVVDLDQCRYRMLDAHRELKPGQGFRKTYEIEGSGRDVTLQIGNAVPPQLSAAIAGRLVDAYRRAA